LFEAKIKTIANKKSHASSGSSHDDSEEDEDDDDAEDGWGSVDEEDDEFDLDPDEFNARAVDDSGDEPEEGFVERGNDRKKKKLNTGAVSDPAAEEVKAAEAAKTAKKAHRKEMDRVFKKITALPPPGCLDKKNVTQTTLLNVLCLTDKNVLRPVVVSHFVSRLQVVAFSINVLYRVLKHRLMRMNDGCLIDP
jgi:hypothetical protein